VLYLKTTGGLHHVEGSDHISVQICPRVLKTVADAGLGREMNDHIRAEIIHVLGNLSGPTADALLRAATEDPSREVRMAACRAWGGRGGDIGAAVLSQVLTGDEDPDVRLAAIDALGQCRDPAAVAALGPALENRDPAMQYRAVLALKDLTGKDLGNDVDRWRQYVQGEVPAETQPASVADRLRRMF